MDTRRDFLQGMVVAAGSMALVSGVVKAQGTDGSPVPYPDKLTDEAGQYVLLPLPYDPDALEPVIDARTVELHYEFHHKPAVANANKAEAALAMARETGDFTLVKHWEKELAFNLSSHILHTHYWSGLSAGGGEPRGVLLEAINRDFGSLDKLKAHLAAATAAVEGAGWGILGYLPAAGKLMVLQCENHQKLTTWGIEPILVLDVWEHAYYLKYQNRRADYVKGLLGIIHWDRVSDRFEAAAG